MGGAACGVFECVVGTLDQLVLLERLGVARVLVGVPNHDLRVVRALDLFQGALGRQVEGLAALDLGEARVRILSLRHPEVTRGALPRRDSSALLTEESLLCVKFLCRGPAVSQISPPPAQSPETRL